LISGLQARSPAVRSGEFSTVAVDKAVDKDVRIAGERRHGCFATLRLQKQHRGSICRRRARNGCAQPQLLGPVQAPPDQQAPDA